MDKLSELYQKGVSRRNFLAGAGAIGAAGLAGCGNGSVAPTTIPTPAVTDTDILNFALNLEYLEAEFYLRAATGSGLSSTDSGGAGTVTGGTIIGGTLNSTQQNIINEIAYDEQQHVRFLRKALGSAAVAKPNIDLTNSFNALAAAAGIGTTFNPFASFNNFLLGAFIFEDVGVTAYTGAAPLISSAANLSAAAGIQAVEAYHAAYVRTILTANAITGATGGTAALTTANQISALRGKLGGGNETPLVLPTGSASVGVASSAIVAADSTNAIAFGRNTDQVLHIVYGTFSNTAGSTTPSAGVAQGGFFPNGLNGNIKVTTS